MKKILTGLFVILCIVGTILLRLYTVDRNVPQKTIEPPVQTEVAEAPEPEIKEPEKSEVTVLSMGDIIFHQATYLNFKDENGNYDFTHFFKEMEEEYKDKLVVGNFETTVNPERKISGFPMFNTPATAVTAIKNAGIDVLTTANNHCIDTGSRGIATTIEEIGKNGIEHTGTFTDPNQRGGIIVSRNGINIGILAYSEMFNGNDAGLKREDLYMINPLNEDKITADIKELRDKGADFIVVYPHFGIEYSFTPSNTQKYWTEYILNAGADMVVGSHPHVPQKAEILNIDGEDKLAVYSLGNFISNQREDNIGKKLTEVGTILEFTLEKEGEKTKVVSAFLKPVYTYRFRNESGIWEYNAVLLDNLLNKTEDPNLKQRLINLKTDWENVVEMTSW